MSTSKRWTNKEINQNVGSLRNLIREGKVKISVSKTADVVNNLRYTISYALGIEPDAFNTENFKPNVLKRFAHLFNTPDNATQDQIAWALTNFINRRANPWSHLKSDLPKREKEDQGEDVLGYGA